MCSLTTLCMSGHLDDSISNKGLQVDAPGSVDAERSLSHRGRSAEVEG